MEKMATGAQQREASLCDKSKQSSFLSTFYQQKVDSKYCDVILKVCNREIHAHSNILAAASPYFESFFALEMPRHYSQKSPQIIEIQIDGNEPNLMYEEAVESVINYIYTNTMTVNESNIPQIYEIGKIMQLENITRFCEDFLHGKVQGKVLYTNASSPKTTNVAVNTDATSVNPALPSWWNKCDPNLDYKPSFLPALHHTRAKFNHIVSVACQTTSVASSSKVEKSTCTDLRIITMSELASRKRKYTSDRETPDSSLSPAKEGRKDESQESNPKKPMLEEDNMSNKKMAKSSDSTMISKSVLNTNDETRNTSASSELIAVKDKERSNKRLQQSEMELTCDSVAADNEESMIAPLHVELVNVNGFIDQDETVVDHETEDISEVNENADDEEDHDVIQKENHRPVKDKKVHLNSEDSELSKHTSVPESSKFAHRKRGRPKKLIKSANNLPKPENSEKSDKTCKEYYCSECKFRTTKVREMSCHMMNHKIREGLCFYCDKAIPDLKELRQHMNSHKNSERPFTCTQCDFRCKSRTTLNLHLPKHSDDKPFSCKECNMSFKWKHALRNHMVVHSNKREHLCDICGYSTAHKAQLKSHHLIHTGQTFKCQNHGCKFETTKKQNLKYHEFTHTRERPHQCEICGQNFSLLKNMKRHMLLHYAAKQCRCDNCDFSTTRYDKLKEHQLKQHGLGTPPERRVKVSDMLATSKLEISPKSDRLVPTKSSNNAGVELNTTTGLAGSNEDTQMIVIQPELEGSSDPGTSGTNQVFGQNDTIAVLNKILQNSGQLASSSDQKVLVTEKDGSQAEIFIHKVEEVDQSELLSLMGTSDVLPQVASIDVSQQQEETSQEPLPSFVVSQDGQVINLGSTKFLTTELPGKLGLTTSNMTISNLLKNQAQQVLHSEDQGTSNKAVLLAEQSVIPVQNLSVEEQQELNTTDGSASGLVLHQQHGNKGTIAIPGTGNEMVLVVQQPMTNKNPDVQYMQVLV